MLNFKIRPDINVKNKNMEITLMNRYFLLLIVVLAHFGCTDDLELVPPGEFSSSNVLQSEAGFTAVLYSAYNFENTLDKQAINPVEVSTDIGYNTGGGENRTLSLFIDFTWDASTGWINGDFWLPKYRTIRDANVILDNLEKTGNLSESFVSRITAEAKYLRASSYAWLYNYFGPVPLRTSGDLSQQEANLKRATNDEILDFIESELMESIVNLPNPGEEGQYGRATKGHALGVLTKFYLESKQWDKVVSASEDLIALNYYELYPSFREMFFIENEGNKEMIVAYPRLNVQGNFTNYQNGAFPPGFRSAPNIPEFEWKPGMANWATQYRLQDNFVDSYNPEDARLRTIIQEYVNADGNLVNLREEKDNSRCLKFFDNDQTGNFCGADMPYIRYADILLARAEALNEINGPTAESLDLVNKVRVRANLSALTLEEAINKDKLRELILAERGWEFVGEGKRRDDLVRHGKFISNAIERGRKAKPHHVLWPIPENEVNANPNIVQNEGY